MIRICTSKCISRGVEIDCNFCDREGPRQQLCRLSLAQIDCLDAIYACYRLRTAMKPDQLHTRATKCQHSNAPRHRGVIKVMNEIRNTRSHMKLLLNADTTDTYDLFRNPMFLSKSISLIQTVNAK